MGDNNKIQWQNILTGGIGSALSAGMGMLLQGQQDRRQLRQQEKLQNLQIKGTKDLTDYNYLKEMEMWKNTSYGAQREQMESAGINPALMYGMGGGGGQTIGTGGGSQVSGGNAPTGGREIQDMIGMGLQMQMMQAQKRVMETQADKNEAEANKTSGVDTTKTETEIQTLTQGLNNQKATEEMTKAQTRMINLGNELAGKTLEDRIEMVNYETKRACQEAQQAVNNTNVSDATIKDKIKIIKREAIHLLLTNTRTEAETSNIEQQTKTGKAQQANLEQNTLTSQTLRRKLATEIEQGWKGINIQEDKNFIQRKLGEAGIDVQEQGQILNAIMGIFGMGSRMPHDSKTYWETYDENTGTGQRGESHTKHR